MSSESKGKLGVGSVVASRFRVDTTLDSTGLEAFLGVEVSTSTPVVLMLISAAEAAVLEKAKHVEHAHLGRLLDVVALDDGRHVAVAARIDGETLEERVRVSGKKEPVAAVRMALRVADALHALHEAGATHGFVHARSVVVEPYGREPPVLAYAPATGTEPWNAPEHTPGAPTPSDDAWAAASLLHLMLTGVRAPTDGYSNEAALEAAGVSDPVLQATLLHALARSQPGRGNLHDLRRELARWFVDHAGEEPLGPGRHTAPPPLPAHPRTRPPSARAVQPPRRRRMIFLAVAAVVVPSLAVWGWSLVRPAKVRLVQLPTATPEPSASAIELGDVPVTGAGEQLLGNKLASCVAGYLPKGAFAKAPSLEWLCGETDPRVGGEKLHGAVVAGAPRGTTTDAMKIFARIGWYDMAAFAVVHNGCCVDGKPVAMPDARAECAMDAALREVGDAVVSARDVESALKKYTESIHCELNQGGGKTLRHSGRPAGGEDTAFLDLVKKLD
ncbi:MAG TPA: hypothetical protein VMS65_01195 [Polyangiaceae bacterium]|nr:hypothetical protein [Polyangiaceae bacterium]